ncbi:MAG: hypothetical protein PUF08_00375 [Clostridiales bacterium]|nr:hypothetical protein [Clostridiales bacterium]
MNFDAEFAKRSKMRIYSHFALPDGVRWYSEGSFADSSKALNT